MAENTARQAGGTCMRRRYAELLEAPRGESRPGEEIAAEVIRKAGLVVTA